MHIAGVITKKDYLSIYRLNFWVTEKPAYLAITRWEDSTATEFKNINKRQDLVIICKKLVTT